MSDSTTPPPSPIALAVPRPSPRAPRSREKQAKRRALAARDGLACFYCRRPFADPQQATLDHFIPRRLWPTWTNANLVLACWTCNHDKADVLPLALVVLLLAAVARRGSGLTTYMSGQAPTGSTPTLTVLQIRERERDRALSRRAVAA